MFRQKFVADFSAITSRIESGTPFAFVRFGDGEDAIIRGRRHVARSDGWIWPHGGLGADADLPDLLYRSLVGGCDDPDWFVGVSAFKHHQKSHEFYLRELKMYGPDMSRVTFAEIFSFSNYTRFLGWTERIGGISRARFSICGPGSNTTYRVPFDAMQSLSSGGKPGAAEIAKQVADEMMIDSMAGVRLPIFVAAGPLANLIIQRYWTECNPARRRTIIDVGSALANYLHGRRNRGYQNPNESKSRWQPQFWPDP